MQNDSAAALAMSVENTKPLLGRFLKGFDDSNHTRQAPGLPNHLAWSLGHLALTMQRVAAMLDGRELATEYFGDRTSNRGVFDPESVCFGSTPTADPTRYPSCVACVAAFEKSCDRLVGALRAAHATDLGRAVPWGNGQQTTIGALAARMTFHNGVHCGQIIDLRRAIGLPPVIV